MSHQPDPPPFFNRVVLVLLALCASPALLLTLSQYLVVVPWGSSHLQALEVFLLFPSFVALPAFFVAPFLLFSRRTRRVAAQVWIGSLVYLVAIPLGLTLSGRIRMKAFDELAGRSAPLVEAIHAYEKREGAPPPNLNALVPADLPAVPHTGMGAYPDYIYVTGDKAATYDGNPWVLVVHTPAGLINFDQFLYFPRQNYPEKGYGGRLQRVRDWAYVFE